MTPDQFRKHGHQVIDWIADYYDRLESFPVLSQVKPGDVRASLPAHAPQQGEDFDAVLADMDTVILPGHHALAAPVLLRLLPGRRERSVRPG